MKHIFIINPSSGKDKKKETLYEKIKEYKDKLDCEIYDTQGPGDATRFVKEYCKNNAEEVTFYACGGDGTINEVVNGLADAKNARLAIYPCGSGNDYVKAFGGQDRFLNFDNLVNGTPTKVDVMKVNDKYSINVTNFGFDAKVCDVANRVRRKKIIGGKNNYKTGIFVALMTGRRTKCDISIDGEPIGIKTILLSTVANGKYVGGAYCCAPRSVYDDGLLEVTVVKPISIFKFMSLMKPYQVGKHLDDPKFEKCLIYKRAKKVTIDSKKPMMLFLDGELITDTHFEIENFKQKVTLILPKE